MKFVISTQEINYMINKCQNAVAQKSTIPVLSNIKIEAREGEIILTATDLIVAVRCTASAKVFEKGVTTLPAKKFASLLRELTAHNVEITTNAHHITEIVADSSRFKLHGMAANEFPDLPDFSDAIKIEMSQEMLKEMFFRTSFAVSKDDNRYALTGVFLQIANGKATFVGTDGKRLAKTDLELPISSTLSGGYIIPVKAVDEIFKCLTNEGNVTLYLKPDRIAVETEDTLLVSKLLSGEYPDVMRVIPEKSEAAVSLHREELSTLLKQVSLFAPEGHLSVRFSFSKGELKLSANAAEVGEGKVSMPVNYHGPDLDIAFNPGFFLDILRHTRGETVIMGLTDSFNPGVLTDQEGVSAPTSSASPLYILMPMRLNSDAH